MSLREREEVQSLLREISVGILLDAVYAVGLAAASPVIAYNMVTRPRWRAGFSQRLGQVPLRESDRRCIWIHTASVGEVLAVRALLTALEAALPEVEFVLSTTSVEGHRTAREKLDREAFYFPIDFGPSVRSALDRVRPDAVLLVEREVWPNFVATAHARGVPVIMVNGIVSESFLRRFRAMKRFGLDPLGKLAHFAVQSETYGARLESLGVEDARVTVTGSIKYDNLPATPDAAVQQKLRTLLGVTPDHWLFVAGSTRETEEETVVRAFAAVCDELPNLRLVLVPRHIRRREEIAGIVRKQGFKPVFKTALDAGADAVSVDNETVVIVDTFGELEGLYSIASAVFVGGTLTPESGGHNFLEPAAFGKPIFIGPHVRNFRDAADHFLEKGALCMVECSVSMSAAMRDLGTDASQAGAMGAGAAGIVKGHRGATGRTVQLIQDVLGFKKSKELHA